MAPVRRWLLWWWARKDVPAEFRFPQAVQNAKRLLILMPEATEALRQSEVSSHAYREFFPRPMSPDLSSQEHGRAFFTILWIPKCRPRFPASPLAGRPEQEIHEAVVREAVRCRHSLNRTASVFFGILTIASKAPVRIGLPGGMGGPFVNVELRHGREQADLKTEFILFVEMIRKLATPVILKPGAVAVDQRPVTKSDTIV